MYIAIRVITMNNLENNMWKIDSVITADKLNQMVNLINELVNNVNPLINISNVETSPPVKTYIDNLIYRNNGTYSVYSGVISPDFISIDTNDDETEEQLEWRHDSYIDTKGSNNITGENIIQDLEKRIDYDEKLMQVLGNKVAAMNSTSNGIIASASSSASAASNSASSASNFTTQAAASATAAANSAADAASSVTNIGNTLAAFQQWNLNTNITITNMITTGYITNSQKDIVFPINLGYIIPNNLKNSGESGDNIKDINKELELKTLTLTIRDAGAYVNSSTAFNPLIINGVTSSFIITEPRNTKQLIIQLQKTTAWKNSSNKALSNNQPLSIYINELQIGKKATS